MSTNQVIHNLLKIKSELSNIRNEVVISSTKEITKNANSNLESRLSYNKGYFGTNIYDWYVINLSRGNTSYIKMRNAFENSASVEFGIGLYGQLNPHPMANDVKYKYNQESNAKSILGQFTFRDKNTGMLFQDFLGYNGKAFLWDSLMYFKMRNRLQETYKMSFDRKMMGMGFNKR